MQLESAEFEDVLARLHDVRDELVRTSSPHQVQRLTDAAAQLVERGEQILREAGTEPSGATSVRTVEPAGSAPPVEPPAVGGDR